MRTRAERLAARSGADAIEATRVFAALVVVAALAACTTPAPVPLTESQDIPGAAVARKPLPEPGATAAAAPAKQAMQTAAPAKEVRPDAPIAVPADTQYVCVVEKSGERTRTAIAFAPRVAQLCARHPEMGPCQYERNLCRSSGGRVYAAGGAEITMATEAEYDRKVMRVRFKAN